MIWQGPFCKGNIYGKGQSKLRELLLERGAGREIIRLIIIKQDQAGRLRRSSSPGSRKLRNGGSCGHWPGERNLSSRVHALPRFPPKMLAYKIHSSPSPHPFRGGLRRRGHRICRGPDGCSVPGLSRNLAAAAFFLLTTRPAGRPVGLPTTITHY